MDFQEHELQVWLGLLLGEGWGGGGGLVCAQEGASNSFPVGVFLQLCILSVFLITSNTKAVCARASRVCPPVGGALSCSDAGKRAVCHLWFQADLQL